MSFTMLWEPDGVITTFHGVVNSEEVMEADRCFYADPRSDLAKYQITDFTQGVPGRVDTDHVTTIAAFDVGSSHSIANLKVALIVRDPFVKTLCEQYIELMNEMNSGWACRICDDMDSARQWVAARLPANNCS